MNELIDFVELEKLLYLSSALVFLMMSNVLIGTVTATIKKEFEFEKMFQGIVKFLAIAVGIAFFYVAGVLLPEFTFEYEGMATTIPDVVELYVLYWIGYYGFSVGENLNKLKKTKVATEESDPVVTLEPFGSIPEETELDNESVG